MDMVKINEGELNLEATELRLGLPGGNKESEKSIKMSNKRALPVETNISNGSYVINSEQETTPASKTQVVGWPPVRSYRKNVLQTKKVVESEGNYVKIGMDGAPYLRKIDLNVYKRYSELLKAMEDMFNFRVGAYSEREGYNGSEYVPTYEDKDGDLMLVGDVPWEMFTTSCKRLRIMKGSEARGLGCVV